MHSAVLPYQMTLSCTCIEQLINHAATSVHGGSKALYRRNQLMDVR